MAEFVTSDGVIEHATGKVVAAGLVARDANGQLRVSGFKGSAPFELPHGQEASLADVIAVLELRIGVETEAAALAATPRTDAQLAAIRSALDAYEAAAEAGSTPAQGDYRFHQAIGGASGNRYVEDLIDYLGPLFIPKMRVALAPEHAGERDAKLQYARVEHRATADAIAAGDPEATRAAMRRHLTRTLTLPQEMEATA